MAKSRGESVWTVVPIPRGQGGAEGGEDPILQPNKLTKVVWRAGQYQVFQLHQGENGPVWSQTESDPRDKAGRRLS